MKNFITVFEIIAVSLVIIVALFSNPGVQDLGSAAAHEIRTFDAWKQSAYTRGTCPLPGSGRYAQQVALQQAPPIMQGEKPPELVKEMGIEVISISGGKVKITGVMGSSWADKAGLKPNDIILRFNKKKYNSFDEFKKIVSSVPPETDYPIRILRTGRVKKLRVTIGEGEMEGFTPIVPVAYMGPMLHNPNGQFYGARHGYAQRYVQNGVNGHIAQQRSLLHGMYQCPRCQNFLMANINNTNQDPVCPSCRYMMRRIQ